MNIKVMGMVVLLDIGSITDCEQFIYFRTYYYTRIVK